MKPEDRKAKKKYYNDSASARKLGLTVEQYRQRIKEKRERRNKMPVRRIKAELKYYAKKKGMSVAEFEALRDSKRLAKERKIHKEKLAAKARASNDTKATGGFTEAFKAKLREKHKAYEGQRLTESINKPIYLKTG